MTVKVLRLSGLLSGDAYQAADALLADRSAPDLTRLLVVDDTATLVNRSAVYERLLTSRRMDHLLCVAVGPRPEGSREFRYPGSISGGQGGMMLWVSNPHGIDWRPTSSAIAVGHSGSSASGLDHLIELLVVDEVFDRVCKMSSDIPGGAASPGIRLARMDDEATNFSAALVMAIRRLTGAGSGLAPTDNEPFTVPWATRTATPSLVEDGELARYRENVMVAAATTSETLTRLSGVGGLFGTGQSNVRDRVIELGSALGAFRNRVARLLQNAHAPNGLTERQRDQLTRAGVRLAGPPATVLGEIDARDNEAVTTASGRSAIFRAIAEAVRAGDPLPLVVRRLKLTASALDHAGSASYLPEVDQACPPTLISRLAKPPSAPRPWRWWLPTAGALAAGLGWLAADSNLAVGSSVAVGVVMGVLALALLGTAVAGLWRGRIRAWRRRLALDEAVRSADALANLVTTVAAKEWSGGNVTLDEITLARIALDGVISHLAEHAAVGDAQGVRAPRAARFSESLLPSLQDLVVVVVAAGYDAASADGRSAFEQARARTAELVAD